MTDAFPRSCSVWVTHLAALHSLDLTPAEMVLLQAHLQAYAMCAEVATAYQQQVATLRRLPPVSPLDSLPLVSDEGKGLP